MKPFHDLHKRIKQEEIKDMNLRDYFAAKAMQSLIGIWDSSDEYPLGVDVWEGSDDTNLICLSRIAYLLAERMIEVRNETN